jgi:hypothetical protein
MSAETIEDGRQEFAQFLNDAAATHHFARRGLRLAREEFAQQWAAAGQPDADYFIGRGEPGTPESLAWVRLPQREVPATLADDGPVAMALGHQWAVSVFTQWEHNFRPRLSAAQNVPLEDLRDDLMGDIRLLRNDIVHHRGVATANNAGRCKVLRWFHPGEPILITIDLVAAFMERAGLTFRVE